MKYNQRIGDLAVKFVDYMRTTSETPTDALEIFSIEGALSANEAYQLALYLKGQGYPIDPIVFHPDNTGGEDEITFQEYDNALQRGEHDKAHRIYQSMTPSQKQVIRDRRGHMNKKTIKTAQQADAEAVIEKEVPAESPAVAAETGVAELIAPAEGIVDQYNSMGLPPDSMRLFLPFAHAKDEFVRVMNDPQVDKVEKTKRTEDFLRQFNKILRYLDEQGFDVDALLAQIKKYAEDLFLASSTAQVASRKMLALAAKLQESGMTDLSSKLMSLAASKAEEEADERETERFYTQILKGRNPGVLEQAEQVVNQTPVVLYEEALTKDDFDQAREIYLHMSPQERQTADQIAKKHFAVQSIVSLYKVGESLFNKGKTKEADEVSDLVKAQFVQLPGEMQQEVILLIIPQDQLGQLPQAFQGGKGKGLGMEEKLMDLQKRLTPEAPQGAPCGSCGCSAKTIVQLLKVADLLDQKGQTEAADQITNALTELTKEAQMPTKNPELTPEQIEQLLKERLGPLPSGRDIGTLKCQSCGADVLFDRKKKEKPQYCTYCAKMLAGGPWTGARIAKKACDDQIEGGLADNKPDEAFDPEELEKGTKVEMEHTNDPKLAKEIASDHLAESPDYYKKLDIMEHSELKEMEGKKEKKTAQINMPGPYEAYKGVPLGGAAKEKADEQRARQTRQTDPTGVRGQPIEKPDNVVVRHEGKEYLMPRDLAIKLNREGKIDELDWEGKTLVGTGVKDPAVLQLPGVKMMEPATAKLRVRPFAKRADKAHDKYVSEEGHFKGKEGSGERWDNCIKYQKSKGHSAEAAEKICGYIKSRKGSLSVKAADDDHGGKPAKVVEIADAIRRDNPGTSDEAAYRMAWETYCSYTNPGHEGCTEKGKSHRESPKPYEKS